MHTAVRTKVPLRKKVRGERSKSKTGPLPPGQSVPKQLLATATGPGGVVTTTAAAGNTTTVLPSTSKDRFQLSRSSTSNPATVVIKQVKRHVGKTTTTTTATNSDSPKKLIKKKKKRSTATPGGPSDESPVKEPITKQKKKKTKSKHKEVIDYSSRSDAHSHTNTFGKVHRWLLESPIVTNATNQFEHASKVTNMMNKSLSTPEHLTSTNAAAVSQQQPRSPKKTRVKTKSVGNINEKVRLQVVYKPPFKFSLKLSKNDPSVKTHIVAGPVGKRKGRMVDRKRVAAAIQSETPRGRAAILVRPVASPDEASEPNYETLNPRNLPESPPSPSSETHVYENVTFNSGGGSGSGPTELPNSVPPPINTATFRINRSASGSNIVNHPSGSHFRNPSITSVSQIRPTSSGLRGSSSNLATAGGSHSNSNSRERDKHRRSYGGAIGGESTESLIRSSTTNLAKSASSKRNSFAEKRRSSSTSLHQRHSGSTSNLHSMKRHSGSSSQYLNQEPSPSSSSPHEVPLGRRHSTSVRPVDSSTGGSNNSSNSMKKQKISRTSSSTNLTQRRSSIGSRQASADRHLSRQTSLNVKPPHKGTVGATVDRRPHTSSCDERQQAAAFEWPAAGLVLPKKRDDDPLPSDLEVMVSDAENLVGDR